MGKERDPNKQVERDHGRKRTMKKKIQIDRNPGRKRSNYQ
jgi:hypothetical protein